MKPTTTRRQRPVHAAAAADGAPVTLDMVARAAGVSPSTVSRILNGTASVSEAKQKAVDEAIARLGFRPNPVARGLAGGRTLSIGVVTQIISSPFYGEALHGIEDELEAVGYLPIFVSGHWRESEERKALAALVSRRVDGIIVLAGSLSNTELQRYAQSLPLVVVGRGEIHGERMASLSFDNHAGACLATRHLIECGHTRIAFVSGEPSQRDARERQAGYAQALQEAGLAFDPALVVSGDFTEPGGLKAANQLLDSGVPFTAIFAANDQTAIGLALGLHRRNVRVPDDISLVGFDDVAPAQFAIPPLTTVRQSVYEMGREAAKAVLALLRGETPTPVPPRPELVPRESTRRLAR